MASTLIMNSPSRSWSGTRKNIIVKFALSFSDLIALNLALFLSAATIQGIWGELD
ncbi:MAG: UDP-phosphate galactose phosphotransferase, partial [Pantoea agglomerans]